MRPALSSLALAALTAVAPGAAAATIKVPQDHATIQAAVLAAEAGDTVLVKPGVYREIVVVPGLLPGLTIKGSKSGRVIIDARVLPAGSGAGVRVFADDVTLKNLVVRHARTNGGGFVFDEGIGVYVTGDDVRLDRVTALHSGDDGILVDGDRAVIRRCVVRSAEAGVVVLGADARVVDTEAEQVSDIGVAVQGDDALIERATVRTTLFEPGILVMGARAVVRDSLVERTNQSGIAVEGDDALIEGNSVRGSSSPDGAIHVPSGDRAVIRGNVCRDSRAPGIFTESSDGRVEDNLVEACGAGIRVVADDVDVLNNTVLETGYDAFGVDGNDNLLAGNLARGNLYDGIEVVGGNGNMLIDNRTIGNHAEGLENDGAFTVMIGNTSRKNRIDVANGGAIDTFEQNDFVTGGPATAPVLDDD